MNELQVTFRLTTPLFLSGADQAKAELHLPSIKGALRFWYRAINGNFNRFIPATQQTYEEELFGSPRSNLGQGRFLLRSRMNQSLDCAILEGRDRLFAGLSYFTFFTKDKDHDQEQKQKRAYFHANQTFTLSFLLRSGKEEEQLRNWQGLLASIWLLGHIGGLGYRNRKGFGSLALEHWHVTNLPIPQQMINQLPIAHRAKRPKDWFQSFYRGLSILNQWFPAFQNERHTIINDQAAFYLPKGETTWNAALKKGAYTLQQFRKRFKKDRLALGLPMNVEQKDIAYRPNKRDGDRMPSPAISRVIHLDKKFYPIYMILPSPFPEVVKENTKNPDAPADKQNIHFGIALDRFTKHLEEKGFRKQRKELYL
ncbi:CRISPR type III-B/RAMP module RAMP protein Cmr1 [Seinonella peptonophila]|uniref:CRISPR type III-B/RAMP module RAMP protein Cmr1 n=1 Tax=Seinonella peptonophila TaxID=112248 RepID=A0A1M5A172_9BACL|nr:type III-B CRISPR module RAMP protein Cmr1 [Seinonella peptonophila]SHF23991.1 CRISPR type III-B/RAMP module RAMP protein Cmr1 [Seinonella peptonophila]